MIRVIAALWVAALAALLLPIAVRHRVPPILAAAARTTGAFPEAGPLPGDRTGPAHGRYWSSWAGADSNEGELALGPFPAPAILGLPVSGYPDLPGNRLFLENLRTGERLDLSRSRIGERWAEVRLWLPAAWRGAPVILHANDHAVAWGGWLAIGQPRAVPLLLSGSLEFARKLGTFLGVGALLALLTVAAGRELAGRPSVPPPLVTLLALAAVALLGYAAFWIFFASPALGRLSVGAAAAVAAWRTLRPLTRAAARSRIASDHWIPAALMLAIGLGYLAVLLPNPRATFTELGQQRFNRQLPGDNEIPQTFAERLERGESPRHLMGDWLSSDRPPLQTGAILLIGDPLARLGLDPEESAQCAGIWMQLLWVPAVWAWLRLAGTRSAVSALILIGLAPTGVLLLNTLYVWPKLFAAGLGLGAYCLWFAVPAGPGGRTARFVAGGVLASLGYLAHGGIAFSLIALVPLALWPGPRIDWKRWTAAAAAWLLLLLPWIAYQRYYEPPGNRLFKWHLAGVIDPDDRGLVATLVQAYRSESVATLWHHRVENLVQIFDGPWRQLLTFDLTDPQGRRVAEFFDPIFTLGWWGLGLVALAGLGLAAWRPGGSNSRRHALGPPLLAAAWCALTLAVWALLMFLPRSTVVHQGSYVSLLLLLTVGALGLWRLHPLAFAAAALAQAAVWPWIWFPLPIPTDGTPAPEAMVDAIVLGGLAVAAMVAIVAAARGQETASVDPAPA